MLKFLAALVLFLVLAMVIGAIRKMRGGTFLPPEHERDPGAPRSLDEVAAEKRRSRQKG